VTDESRIAEAKQRKIDQISELELIPMFIRYSYKNKIETHTEDNNSEISSAHVVFQKEVLAEKWNMIHVTELSFVVNNADFDEFEKMSGFSLNDNFRDLTAEEKNQPYKGKERRQEKR
jgi:predicted N-acyltransferase